MDSKRILVIAGEVSGDRLAADVLRYAQGLARDRNMHIDIFGIAGTETASLGAQLYYTAEEMSVIGFSEVIKKYFFFRRAFRRMTALLDEPSTMPDVVLLVDYPGFNIRFTREAKKRGIRVVFFVSPQIWAWKKGRIRTLVANTDSMLVLFPFEVELYNDAGHNNVRFVGHPLIERINSARSTFLSKQDFAKKHNLDASKKWLVIFPGSRKSEIERHLHIMIAAADLFDPNNEYEHIIVRAPSISLPDMENAVVLDLNSESTYNLLSLADTGIFKSGTTTLEAALLGIPGVICYKTSPITYVIAKYLITLPYIGLANIALGKKLYPELVQSEMTADNISRALQSVITQKDKFNEAAIYLSELLRSPTVEPSAIVANELLK